MLYTTDCPVKEEQASPKDPNVEEHGDSPHAEPRVFHGAQQAQNFLSAAGTAGCQGEAGPRAAQQTADDAGREDLVKHPHLRNGDHRQQHTVKQDAGNGLAQKIMPKPGPGNGQQREV